jgi:hypothetical protein
MFKQLVTLVATALLGGCVSYSGLDPRSNYQPTDEETVIVLRVEPRYRIHVFKGENQDARWIRNPIAVTLNTFPTDGYIVAKLNSREGALNYGISGFLPEGIGFGPAYFPCKGDQVITFSAPRGRVVYVGDLVMGSVGRSIPLHMSAKNIDAARVHLRDHFPLIADKLVPGEFKFRKLDFTAKENNLNCPTFDK